LGQNFTPGTAATVLNFQTKAGEMIRMAPLICFEDSFGRLARRYAASDPPADILVNITNDGWFNRSFQSRQHLANAVFRAVENRMPLLRVSNNGITALISHKGILRQEDMLGQLGADSSHDAGVLKVRIAIPVHQPTLYQQWGDWVGILGCLAIFFYLPLWWSSK
jgi:apolipoprotein N-acyltransferase